MTTGISLVNWATSGVLLAVALVLSAGCLTDGQSGMPSPQGTFVSVTESSSDRALEANASARENFDALSEPRQAEFLEALEQSHVGANAWKMGTDIEYVRYDGAWYHVSVAVVN